MPCNPTLAIAVLAFGLMPASAWAVAAHSGAIDHRSSPELSDVALALFAAGAFWFVRRALRARFRDRGKG